MTIRYCDFINGNDSTGNGSAGNPYKTITTASTGLTGGDEVRVAKSPDPTALTGTLTFTDNSTTVTGSGTLFTSELVIGDFIEADSNWWEVVTIGSNTSATLYRVYSGAAAAGISSRKLGVTSTGAAASSSATVQSMGAAGSSLSNMLKVSGGWDLGTQTQTGFTWFRQMHGTFSIRWGRGLMVNFQFVEIDKLGFLRYDFGVYMTNPNTSLGNVVASSNNTYGIYVNGTNNCTLGVVVANSNGNTGVIVSPTNNAVCGSISAKSNVSFGLDIRGYNCSCGQVTANRNGNGGVNVLSAPGTTIRSLTALNNISGIQITGTADVVILSATLTGNTNGILLSNGSRVRIGTATMSGNSTPVSVGTPYAGSAAFITDYNGNGGAVWTDGGNIAQQAASAGGTGKEWKLHENSGTRRLDYPLSLPVATIAVQGGTAVTVKLFFTKQSTGIAGRLLCKGGQIAGVPTDVSATCPDDTNRNQVQISFAPSAAGVVEIEAQAWYVSGMPNVYLLIDDIEITQA